MAGVLLERLAKLRGSLEIPIRLGGRAASAMERPQVRLVDGERLQGARAVKFEFCIAGAVICALFGNDGALALGCFLTAIAFYILEFKK
jgi:hypothetical protein